MPFSNNAVVSSPQASIADTLRITLNSIQEWASDPKDGGCGSQCRESDADAEEFDNDETTVTGLFDLGEAKTSEDSPFFNVLRCSGRDISRAVARSNFNCPVGSDELSCPSEDDQMRRLASWGTFGTQMTNDSIGTSADRIIQLDDDGNPIDLFLLEKAKRNREKFRVKKRAVKFAYPPISSLKQCPRVDSDDVDRLFFSTEELELYEQDRRSTGTVDDVEIVAVSTSLSDEVPVQPTNVLSPPPSNTSSNKSSSSSIPDWSPKSSLAKYLPSPRNLRKPITEQHEARGRQLLQWEFKSRRRQTPESPHSHSRQGTEEMFRCADASTVEKPKEKRLLKSVQIFLRARSMGN